MALGVLGVAYAAWSQTLNVNATVKTGELKVQFGPSPAIAAYFPHSLDGSNTAQISAVTGVGTDALTFTISNAYPGLSATIPVSIQNVGTIPASVAWGTVVIGPTGYETQLTVSGVLPAPSPISPSSIASGGSITIHVNDNAVMNGTYSVVVPIVATQAP